MGNSKETQQKILELELEKENLAIRNLERKIRRFEKANEIVKNVISQDDIDEVKLELKKKELQKKIIESQMDALDN